MAKIRLIAMLGVAAGLVVSVPGAVQADMRELPAYNSISEDLSEQRRAVYVRVDRRIDEDDLLRIASQIEARGKRPFARTYVNFILPGMPVNQGAWASVLFAPDPKVMVHGLSRSDEELFLSEHRADGRPLLGSWLTSPPAAPGRLTIYSDHGKVFAEWRLRGGQKTVDELHDSTVKSVRRFDVPGGGYYALTRSGELEIWDKTTLIATAERIRPENLALPAMASNRRAAPAPVRMAATLETASRLNAALPSSPVQPEPVAAPVAAASSASTSQTLPVATGGAVKGVASAEAVPAPVRVFEPEPVEAKTKQKKSAKAKPRQNKVAGPKAAGAKMAGVSKPGDLKTGDMVSAKLAGKI
ncbi:MAG: hypothetical protein ABL901_05775 [Hyphomicrobiaceae bacterium]